MAKDSNMLGDESEDPGRENSLGSQKDSQAHVTTCTSAHILRTTNH